MKKNKAEKLVREHLCKMGFSLDSQRDERHNGVDVVALKNGMALLIEVKKAKRHNRAWQVDPVSEKQKAVCTTIAIVLPNGSVLFEPMSQHLKLCAKNGMRYLTEMVNLCKLF
jgi:Holliday junction resolvase-like predicted endonuclease